jgi:hypothetical protein
MPVSRAHSADDCNATGLKLGKCVTYIPEIPRLGRWKFWIVLGHGVAPSATGTLDIQYSLGGSVMCAIGNVTQDGNLSTAIQPSHIIGRTALHDDLCSEHAHSADPLANRSFNCYGNRVIESPQTSANTMLAISDDVKVC